MFPMISRSSLRWHLAVAVILCAPMASAAYAQQPQPAQPPAVVADLLRDWQAMQTAQAHVAKSVQALIAERDKLASDLKTITAERDKFKADADKGKKDPEGSDR